MSARSLLTGAMVMLMTFLAVAQTADRPSFDVSSIRPNKDVVRRGPPIDDIKAEPGSLIARKVTLSALIRWAYDIRPYQVSGPAWVNGEKFDLAAKSESRASVPQLRLMLQRLLAERFGLVFHRETKTLSGYALVEAKGGHKCKEVAVENELTINEPKQGSSVGHVHGAPVTFLLDVLYMGLEIPVVDMTGLKGRYDCTVDAAPYRPQGPEDRLSMVMLGMQEQLGLKLESKKLPIEILIVDKAEKVPTEN